MVCISDGETAKLIFSDIDKFTGNPGFKVVVSLVANNSLLLLYGPEWRERRKTIVGTFAPAQLRYAADITDQLVDKLISKLSKVRQNCSIAIEFVTPSPI
jgi:cytochrome P450